MAETARPLAVVTGASTGIGYELARCSAREGYDLLVVADEPRIEEAGSRFSAMGVGVETLQTDLASIEGVKQLVERIAERPVDVLIANAGTGAGRQFLDQEFDDALHVINTNVVGTLQLVHGLGRSMRERGRGRILITGSIAGLIPGANHAVYNASKAFLNSFSVALATELKGSGVTVTCLMPGATETEFFRRAGMLDTKVGQGRKDSAADVAEAGFRAMMKGEAEVVTGWQNKVQAAIANVTPSTILAEQHRRQAAHSAPSTP